MSIADQLVEKGTRQAQAGTIGRLERLLGIDGTPPERLEALSSSELDRLIDSLEAELRQRLA